MTLVALGVGHRSSSTACRRRSAFFDLFGAPGVLEQTLLLFGFLGIVVAARARGGPDWSGSGAIGAGLLPIAVGYLIAHYLTYLLIDGQRIVIAISDPFQRGWDLFGTAFFTPTGDWLPPGLVWTIQLAAVVGGPHARRVGRPRACAARMDAAAPGPRHAHRRIPGRRAPTCDAIPLAVVMVGARRR